MRFNGERREWGPGGLPSECQAVCLAQLKVMADPSEEGCRARFGSTYTEIGRRLRFLDLELNVSKCKVMSSKSEIDWLSTQCIHLLKYYTVIPSILHVFIMAFV